ncbi:hypothetical protein TIFTF001_007521 [Ficus carica]|uniref:Uncharacterized protein n=1 Tax=Ficus carica TaxID=3494 RepID=A0AA87ZRU6_FICCA|nr:hypothetical protein TIFTF001_007521 [Ficus carica]
MRRKHGDESSLSCEVKKFLSSRKMVKKALRKALENKCSFSLLNKDQEISSSWSLVSKLMNSKKVSCEEVIKSNEFTSADAALNLLIGQKMKKSDSTLEENAQNELQILEMCIQDLEEGVEKLYRRLIKTRVSLLNILNHLLTRK